MIMAQNILPADEEETVKVIRRKKTIAEDDYQRGIKKIASYSGVARIMECTNKCGKFDDIVNIYVFPNGVVEDEYNDPNNKVIDEFLGQNTISSKSVKDKDLTLWSKNRAVADRRKKPSKSVKRRIVHKNKKR